MDAGGLIDRMQKQTSESITLFEGCNDHLLPIHKYDLLLGRFFIIYFICNSYHSVMGLCLAVVVYLIPGSHDAAIEHITLKDVPDLYTKSC